MKATIKLISRYEATLVDVIRWLDENKHSNTYIRETVDRMLNHEKYLKSDSDIEIHNAEVTKNRHIRQLEKNENRRST